MVAAEHRPDRSRLCLEIGERRIFVACAFGGLRDDDLRTRLNPQSSLIARYIGKSNHVTPHGRDCAKCGINPDPAQSSALTYENVTLRSAFCGPSTAPLRAETAYFRVVPVTPLVAW